MSYLLDTDTCIYIIKRQPISVLQRIQSLPIEAIAISSISVAELEHGVAKSLHQERNAGALLEFLTPFRILEFDQRAAYHYGRVRARLELEGQIISPLDMLIASQALAEDLVLVTNNEKEFRRISHLKVENWT